MKNMKSNLLYLTFLYTMNLLRSEQLNDGNLTSFEIYKLGCELFRMYSEIVIRFGFRMILRIVRILEGVIHLDG